MPSRPRKTMLPMCARAAFFTPAAK
jgi:hypothetical protein